MKIIEDIDGLYAKIEAKQSVIARVKNGSTPSSNHADNLKMVQEAGYDSSFPFYFCFPVAQFLFYYLGGYDTIYELRNIRDLPLDLGHTVLKTTHWYVRNTETDEIIDLTKSQFDNDMVNIEDYYDKSRRANFGFPYFKRNGKRYEKTMPSKRTMDLYHALRDEIDSPHLEWLYQESLEAGLKYK